MNEIAAVRRNIRRTQKIDGWFSARAAMVFAVLNQVQRGVIVIDDAFHPDGLVSQKE